MSTMTAQILVGTSHQNHGGIDFEKLAMDYFKKSIPDLTMPYWIPIGHIRQKEQKFDLGSSEHKVIIECKSHTWIGLFD